jgi:hypothetical protein
MSTTAKPLSEITEEAIAILSREMGVANTLRFLSQFTTGNGNYTEERDALERGLSVEEIFAEARRRQVASR